MMLSASNYVLWSFDDVNGLYAASAFTKPIMSGSKYSVESELELVLKHDGVYLLHSTEQGYKPVICSR